MSYYIKETVGDVTVEIGYNTLEELQARLREIDPKCVPPEAVEVETVEPREPEQPKEQLYIVYWPGTKVGTAWIHASLDNALADINEADCGTPELYDLGRQIPLKAAAINKFHLGKMVVKWSVE